MRIIFSMVIKQKARLSKLPSRNNTTYKQVG